ncbi:MAG: thymidylate kinase [Nitrospirae bacterium]|nr:thymidylate kinase [Nitrospirota bacterium]
MQTLFIHVSIGTFLFMHFLGYNGHMDDLKKNIFLTGAPSSGKTTVMKKVIALLPFPSTGFYTEEERVAGKRVGFVMKTLGGKSGYLAHQDIQSDFHIRRYGVSIEHIETIAVPSITPCNRHIIIIDEIGKMECFSEVFKQAALAALDSPSIVVGTITLGGDDFITRIKSRGDIEIHEVTQENRDSLPDLILERVARLLRQ